MSPFRDELADELAEAGGLVSFLAYEYGLGIKQELKESFAKEEERLKAEEIEKAQERISAMKRRLKNSGISIEDYVIALEKQNNALENESKRAKALSEQVISYKEEQRRLIKENDDLRNYSETVKSEMEQQKILHFEEIQALNSAHEDAIHELIVKHEAKTEELTAKFNEEIAGIKDEALKDDRTSVV